MSQGRRRVPGLKPICDSRKKKQIPQLKPLNPFEASNVARNQKVKNRNQAGIELVIDSQSWKNRNQNQKIQNKVEKIKKIKI
jgi:hypothetical protein